MGWTVLPYTIATGGAVTDLDMTAVADAEFAPRNNHIIFTEPYDCAALVAMGATASRFNVQIPQWNAIGRFNVWPIMISSAKILSPPRVMWHFPNGPHFPQKEEITIKVTAGAAENDCAMLFPITPGHSRNLPAGEQTIPIRATAAITQVAAGWSAPVALTMEQSLRGGVYSIVGAECVCVNSAAFRLIFPSSRFYKGRRLRPGWLCQDVIGDLPDTRFHIDPYYLGEWGRFHSFELPQIEVFGIAAAAGVTVELRLWLKYLGSDDDSLLRSWASQGWQ